jgi:putative membrane protein
MSKEDVATTKAMALNQGFYNGGLACVLLWALFTANHATVLAMLLYVVAMAVVGALSVSPRIFLIQGVPAVAALVLTLLA